MQALRPALVACAAVVTVMAVAPAAEAYKLAGCKLPSRTITYHNATPFGKSVRMAAAAWNRSAARIRWVAAPASRARIRIVLDRSLYVSGFASFCAPGGRGFLRLHTRLPRRVRGLTRRETVTDMAKVIAHEMGHNLGLDHVVKACAIMNQDFFNRCRGPRELWRFRCRLLERDDVKGAVRLYGGRVKRAAPPFCDRAPRLRPPTQVEVAAASGTPRISWRTPRGADLGVQVVRRTGACPKGPRDPRATNLGAASGKRERGSLQDFGIPGPGRHCYAVFGVDRFERPGRMATATYDHAGPAGGEPQASFVWDVDAGDSLLVLFADESYDPDGVVAARAWNFGDGSTAGDDPTPSHRYAAAGSYVVTLSVTDDSGIGATYQSTVTVED
jgi:hypothetical protein